VLKVDLHTHTCDDPQDRIRYSSRALIDRAARLGFDALAITNHNAVSHTEELAAYADERGILLLPGAEITADGCHILIIRPGVPISPQRRYALSDLPRLRTPGSLLIAPHPYFIIFQSLGRRVEGLLPRFDAIEIGSYHNRLIDFNRRARRLAARTGWPLVGTSDCHTLTQFGRTYSLVDADKTADSIIAAVKAGRIQVRASPLPLFLMASVVAGQFSLRKLGRLFGGR
jgi:predicted metal-dependent phosphoesterase TrpH